MQYLIRNLAAAVIVCFAALAAVTPAQANSHNDQAFWSSIRDSRQAYDYERYIDAYPYGRHVDKAERRIARFRSRDSHEQAEAALGLSRGQRREVEMRLSRAGFYPGSINGDFSRETRIAIRDFRQSRGLPVHRYLDARMVRTLVRDTGDEYARGYGSGGTRDGEIAAGVVAGALLLGGIILLAD